MLGEIFFVLVVWWFIEELRELAREYPYTIWTVMMVILVAWVSGRR